MSAPRRWRCKRELLIIADGDWHCFYVCYSGDIHSLFLTFGTATGKAISPHEIGSRSHNLITSNRIGAWGEIFSQPRSKFHYNFLMTTVKNSISRLSSCDMMEMDLQAGLFCQLLHRCFGTVIWNHLNLHSKLKEHCVRISVEKLKLKTLSEIICRMCLNSCFDIMISMYCVPDISSKSGSKACVLAV